MLPKSATIQPQVEPNNITITHKEHVLYWAYTYNGGLKPEFFPQYSRKEVYWLCPHGRNHVYLQKICDRVRVKPMYCKKCAELKLPQEGYVRKPAHAKGIKINRSIPNDRLLINARPDLAELWDYSMNGDKTPYNVPAGSGESYYWICPNNAIMKHSYPKRVADMAKLKGDAVKKGACGYCAGKQVLQGYNDLASRYKDIAKTWDYEKNGDLTPEEVPYGSSTISAWFHCYNTKYRPHSFYMVISNRIQGHECNVCANMVCQYGINDLETLCKDNGKEYLLAEWDYKKNYPLTPQDIPYESAKQVAWICKKCGYSWEKAINRRTGRGDGCPVCSNSIVVTGLNDFVTMCKKNNRLDLLEEWDTKENNKRGIDPTKESFGSATSVTWKCKTCKCNWDAKIIYRTQGHKSGCLVCANKKIVEGVNDLATFCKNNDLEYLLKEWDYAKNKDKKPSMFPKGTPKRVWWRCSKCNYSWKASISARTGEDRTGCPKCRASKLENLGITIFSNCEISFKKEYVVRLSDKHYFRYDFLLKDYKLLIEFDGEQHFKDKTYYAKLTPLSERIINDNAKSQYAFEHSVPLLRIPYIYDPLKNKAAIERLLKDFIKTKRIPQEIIDFYARYEFSNYATLARKWNAIRG